ncbi:hypothetical protein [Streptomyces xanthochromogenes]|uniref:Uncharacterized protein n=1 Tax=Streptomyces xanthochromogenes TaxID=67384 RepID=A0ABQ2ZWD4_9ACTN|nr:hypothetical protein [Streptomyces xanthochromogenes]GGY27828.1 hypothetical protein GCM10010326_21740 [Streptomyces xanthochromogenes]
MKNEQIVDPVFRPGAVDGEPVVWLVNGESIPFCEVSESAAQSLLFELAGLFGLVVFDPKSVSEVSE